MQTWLAAEVAALILVAERGLERSRDPDIGFELCDGVVGSGTVTEMPVEGVAVAVQRRVSSLEQTVS